MAATEKSTSSNRQLDRGTVLTVAATALLLALPVFYIGGQHAGTRAGTVLALLVLIATGAFGRAAFSGRLPRPFNGSGVLLLFSAFACLSVLSIGWSLLPGESYLDSIRVVAYTAVVATAALAAQLIPSRSREVVGGFAIASTVIVGYALLSRVMPGWFPTSDGYARLRMPFEYWNAVGLVAVFALVSCMWMATRRDHKVFGIQSWIEIAAYPAGGLAFVALLLSQSRGALVAAIGVIAVWLLLVDRRLRTVAWLTSVTIVGSLVVAWAYAQPALSLDAIPLDQRESTGKSLGLALLLLIAALSAIGFAVEKRRHSVALGSTRREAIGRAMLIALAISPFLLVGLIAIKADNGVNAIPDRVSALFEGTAAAPSNSPDRLTQTSSLRARYWNDAFKIFEKHSWHGTGADTYSVSRLPFRTDTIQVLHAHGFIPQVMADLGVLGLLIAVALALAWLVLALRILGAAKRSPTRWLGAADDKRLAEVAIALIAIGFGIHSAVDWTWFIPGVALFGLVSMGWVAGSPTSHGGELSSQANDGSKLRIARAVAISVVGIALAFAVYQPVRAQDKIDAGIDLVESNPRKALTLGREAHDLDPTSDEAFFLTSTALNNLGQRKAADQVLMNVATEQPGNPETWLRLAEFRLNVLDDPAGAISALIPLLYQSPNNERGNLLLVEAKDARVDELIEDAADRERRKLERELRKLERELAEQGLATPATP